MNGFDEDPEYSIRGEVTRELGGGKCSDKKSAVPAENVRIWTHLPPESRNLLGPDSEFTKKKEKRSQANGQFPETHRLMYSDPKCSDASTNLGGRYPHFCSGPDRHHGNLG